MILFNPVVDNSLEGYGFNRVKDYYEDFSPIHNIKKNAPPTIFFLGTEDNIISVETAQKFKEKMEAVGARCDLFFIQDKYNIGIFAILFAAISTKVETSNVPINKYSNT